MHDTPTVVYGTHLACLYSLLNELYSLHPKLSRDLPYAFDEPLYAAWGRDFSLTDYIQETLPPSSVHMTELMRPFAIISPEMTASALIITPTEYT